MEFLMSKRFLTFLCALVAVIAVVWVASIPVAGQAPAAGAGTRAAATNYKAPRTPWGDPDISGVYTNKDENGIPMERPGQFANLSLEEAEDSSEFAEIQRERNARALERAVGIGGADTGAGPIHWYEHYDSKNSRPWRVSDPEDGRIPPVKPEAVARRAARQLQNPRRGFGSADSYEDRSLYDRCITRGLPGSMMPAIYGNSYAIVQGPGFVAINYEMIHETRIVPLDARPHLGKHVRLWMGDARGRWEGETLVVETTNFSDRSVPQQGNADVIRTIERFTRVAPNKVEWSMTLDDPTTWERPWTFGMALTMDDTQFPFEYACHEGNRGLQNILSGARADEKATEEAARKK